MATILNIERIIRRRDAVADFIIISLISAYLMFLMIRHITKRRRETPEQRCAGCCGTCSYYQEEMRKGRANKEIDSGGAG